MKRNRCRRCDTVSENIQWHSMTCCKNCYQREYVASNKLKRICITCSSESSKGSWYKGPKCSKCYHNSRYKQNRGKTLGQKYCHMLSGSKRRNSITDITKTDYALLLALGCFYCGRNLYESTGHSLDKIDSDGGYVLSNVLPCCGDCNSVRMNILTVEETLKVIQLIKQMRNTVDSPWLKLDRATESVRVTGETLLKGIANANKI